MENIKEPILTESARESVNLVFDGFDFNSIITDITSGHFSPEKNGLINKLIGLFFGELKESASLIGGIFFLVIISAILNNLQDSLNNKSVSLASRFSLYIYLATIAVSSFESASAYVFQTLHDMTVLIHSAVPAMAALYVSGGGVAGAFSHPVVFFVCSAFSTIIKKVITPLCLLRAGASLLSGIGQTRALYEFSEIFAKLHRTILALSMTLFAGILGVSHFASNSFDNLTSRGLRFAITTAVPIVGGSISEAMSSVMQSALLLKNAVGIASVIMLFAMFIVPSIKIWAISFLFRIASAISSPVADENVSSTLKTISECMEMLFSSVVCMGVIMVISVASLM